MRKNWIKQKISDHWKFFGKNLVFIRRDFKNNTVLIDFMGGGSCTLYTYDGKYIAG